MATQKVSGISKATEKIIGEARTGSKIPQPQADILLHWAMLSNNILPRMLSLENISLLRKYGKKIQSVQWQGHLVLMGKDFG